MYNDGTYDVTEEERLALYTLYRGWREEDIAAASAPAPSPVPTPAPTPVPAPSLAPAPAPPPDQQERPMYGILTLGGLRPMHHADGTPLTAHEQHNQSNVLVHDPDGTPQTVDELLAQVPTRPTST